jgi:hypothetical protein
MSCPFRLGDTWEMMARPEVKARIVRKLISREWRDYEAWARTDGRVEGLCYYFDEEGDPRYCDVRISVDVWRRANP